MDCDVAPATFMINQHPEVRYVNLFLRIGLLALGIMLSHGAGATANDESEGSESLAQLRI